MFTNVQDILSDKLQVSVQIDDMYRLGKPIPGKIRPIKVVFPLLSDRNKVLKARDRLEGTFPKMFITEDLAQKARQKAYAEKFGSAKPGPSTQTAAVPPS